MADVKWIKITTDIFDDEKIQLIESMPDADGIITIWFKLLVLAGKQNNNGVFMMNDKIPYTDEMLATIFHRKINAVRLALDTFEKFGMIERIDGVVTIPNWGKHQTLDSYERKKLRDREYQRQRRNEQKKIVEKSSDISSDSRTTVARPVEDSSSYVAVSDKEEDKDIERDIEKERDNKRKPKDPKHQYGEYNHVLLTDKERDRLFNDYGEAEALEAIRYLDEYIEMKGYKAQNHNLAIRKWVFKALERERQEQQRQGNSKSYRSNNGSIDWSKV